MTLHRTDNRTKAFFELAKTGDGWRSLRSDTLWQLFGKSIGYLNQTLVPILVTSSIGIAEFGVLTTLASVINLLSFSDSGVGNAIVNPISRRLRRHNASSVAFVMWAALSVTIGLSFVAGVALVLLDSVLLVKWLKMDQRLTSIPLNPIYYATVSIGCFLVISSIGQRAAVAANRFKELNVAQLAGAGVVVLTTISLSSIHAPAFAYLLPLTCGPVVSALVLLWMIRWLPSPSELRFTSGQVFRASRKIAALGGAFAILQALSMFILQSPLWFTQRTSGLAAAGEFSIIFRLGYSIPLLVSLPSVPMWPRLSGLLYAGQVLEVRRLRRRLTGTAAICGALLSIGFLAAVELFGQSRLGVGEVSVTTCVALFVFFSMHGVRHYDSVLLNAANQVPIQLALFLIAVLIQLTCYAFLPTANWVGPVALAASEVVLVLGQSWLISNYLNKLD